MHDILLREAEKEYIEVVDKPFRGRLKGLYYNKVIALNKNIPTTAERSCILAEELGHYYTSAGDILDQGQIKNRKMERRARTWAYEKLVPLDKLVEAYKSGAKNRFELAEYLEVTEEFLDDAIRYYKEKYGFYRRIGNCFIFFDPLTIIEQFIDKNFYP